MFICNELDEKERPDQKEIQENGYGFESGNNSVDIILHHSTTHSRTVRWRILLRRTKMSAFPRSFQKRKVVFLTKAVKWLCAAEVISEM
jgi:hypothetical protein